ncbi:MAG: helicase HerA-like domain-containing protein, partial [Chitinophagales bacterium]
KKYNTVLDRESAYEILTEKMERSRAEAAKQEERKEKEKENNKKQTHTGGRKQRSTIERMVTSPTFNTVVRGVFNVLLKNRR